MRNDSCNPSVKLFSVRPEANTEALLANACETIAGAGAMTNEFAETLPSQPAHTKGGSQKTPRTLKG